MRSSDDSLRSELAKPEPGLERSVAERHHELESACLELLDRALSEDPHALATRWRDLDAALRDHMIAEEDLIIPAYQLSAPEEAVELRTEHARLRGLLDEVGADVQHNALHAERLRRLLELLHAHAKREDTSMYPWAERNLPLVARRQLYHRISHWLRGRSARLANRSRR
jgi:hypothetical protein